MGLIFKHATYSATIVMDNAQRPYFVWKSIEISIIETSVENVPTGLTDKKNILSVQLLRVRSNFCKFFSVDMDDFFSCWLIVKSILYFCETRQFLAVGWINLPELKTGKNPTAVFTAIRCHSASCERLYIAWNSMNHQQVAGVNCKVGDSQWIMNSDG